MSPITDGPAQAAAGEPSSHVPTPNTEGDEKAELGSGSPGPPSADHGHVGDTTTGAGDPPMGNTSRNLVGVRWCIVIVAILSSTFLYALDNTIMANVRPSMVQDLGNRVDMLPWLSVSYPMGEVGTNPLWGKLNKYFDAKLLYLFAVAVFEIGSALCGSARSVDVATAGRAIAGAGGSGIYVGTMYMISAMTTEAERTNYLNFVGITWCMGTILGPVVGGAFADSPATWRWAFYINICIAGLSVPACAWLIPSTISPPPTASFWERVKRVDYVGASLFTGGVVNVVMILGFGGALYSWTSGQTVALYASTPAIWLAFCVQQRFSLFTKDRVFPAHFVADRDMVLFFSWAALAISNVVVTVYSLPLYFQFVHGVSALSSAAYTIPFVVATVVVGGLAGPLITKYPVYMPWFCGAGVLMLIGNALLTTMRRDTPFGTICGFAIISGVGCGPIMQLGYTAAQCKVCHKEKKRSRWAMLDVTSFMSCAQMAGLALSLGIATSLFLNGATNSIAALLPQESLSHIQATIQGARTDLVQNLSPELGSRVLGVVAADVAKVFYMNVAGAAFGIVLSLFMKRERLQLDSIATHISEIEASIFDQTSGGGSSGEDGGKTDPGPAGRATGEREP